MQMKRNELEKYNIDFHEKAKEKYGTCVKSLGWGSKYSQEIRFKAMTEIGFKSKDTVLDVGCGFGDLVNYLEKKNIKLQEYTGIDLDEYFIRQAKEYYEKNNTNFYNCSLFEFQNNNCKKYDWVVASGIFSFDCKNWDKNVLSTMTTMFSLARKGISVNFLSSSSKKQKAGFKYVNPDCMVKNNVIGLSKNYVIKKNYKVNDFTLHVYTGEIKNDINNSST